MELRKRMALEARARRLSRGRIARAAIHLALTVALGGVVLVAWRAATPTLDRQALYEARSRSLILWLDPIQGAQNSTNGAINFNPRVTWALTPPDSGFSNYLIVETWSIHRHSVAPEMAGTLRLIAQGGSELVDNCRYSALSETVPVSQGDDAFVADFPWDISSTFGSDPARPEFTSVDRPDLSAFVSGWTDDHLTPAFPNAHGVAVVEAPVAVQRVNSSAGDGSTAGYMACQIPSEVLWYRSATGWALEVPHTETLLRDEDADPYDQVRYGGTEPRVFVNLTPNLSLAHAIPDPQQSASTGMIKWLLPSDPNRSTGPPIRLVGENLEEATVSSWSEASLSASFVDGDLEHRKDVALLILGVAAGLVPGMALGALRATVGIRRRPGSDGYEHGF